MALNKAQKRVLEVYEGGEFANLAKHTSRTFGWALERCGDGLLRFIVREVSNDEGCTGVAEARRRLQVAKAQLESLINKM